MVSEPFGRSSITNIAPSLPFMSMPYNFGKCGVPKKDGVECSFCFLRPSSLVQLVGSVLFGHAIIPGGIHGDCSCKDSIARGMTDTAM